MEIIQEFILLHAEQTCSCYNCFTIIFWSEINIYELLGIIIISLGILSISTQDRHSFFPWIARKNTKAIGFALLTGLFIGGYSIVDGYGARASFSPLSFMGWSFIVNALLFPILLKIMNKPDVVKRVLVKLNCYFGLVELFHI